MLTWDNWKETLTEIEKPLVDFYVSIVGEYKEQIPELRVLEVGSGWGLFTKSALEVVDRIITIDPIEFPKDFAKNTEGLSDRIEKITDKSENVLPTYEDKSFDFIFIDGDHGYEGVKKDLKEAWRLVSDTGIIMLDDVWHKGNDTGDYGVMKAIKEFCFDKKLPVTICPLAHGIALIKK